MRYCFDEGEPSCKVCTLDECPEICSLPAAADGSCEAHIPSWTYNSDTGECAEFVYGGMWS